MGGVEDAVAAGFVGVDVVAVFSELSAEAREGGVDGTQCDAVAVAPHFSHYLVACEDAVAVRHEEVQHGVLGGCEAHG